MIMWRFLLVVLSVSLLGCGPNCSDFKKGRFKLEGQYASDIIVERDDMVQVESSVEGKYKNEFFLDWIDDCNYSLVLKYSDNSSSISLGPQDTLKVEIVETNGDRCLTVAKLDDLRFEVYQVKMND